MSHPNKKDIMDQMPLTPMVVSVEMAARLLTTSKQNIYLLAKYDSNFPKIFRFGKRRSGILYSELEEWVQKKRNGVGVTP